MKQTQAIWAVLFALLAFAGGKSHAGVSISVGEPGFYGRIDIGGFPAPRLIYPEPIIVHRVSTWYPPLYLRVPPGHAKQWYRYCGRYGACGRPVYFIDDGWYRNVYAPRYRERHHHKSRYAPPPPHYRPRPEYYNYKKYEHRPPKRIYPQRDYYHGYPGDHRGGKHR